MKPKSTSHLAPDTIAVHADVGIESIADLAPPIHVATTFLADNVEGLSYARTAQPTRTRLEAVLGALEGGSAVVYASGQAASHAALLHFAPRRVAIARGGYHGAHALLEAMSRMGIERVDLGADLDACDLVWLETPRNPTCEIEDIRAHAERTKKARAQLLVDSTFATPVLQNPLALGADVVLHSMTKFLCGHSDAMGGALVLADPVRAETLRNERAVCGAVLGSLETWLALRGLRTLGVRVRRQCETATLLAAWLEGRVSCVWHPSRPSHPGFALAKSQMRGPGAVLSIELDSEEQARALPRSLEIFRDATSLGGVESVIEWRHKWDRSAPRTLLRISVGLEDPADLIADLERVL